MNSQINILPLSTRHSKRRDTEIRYSSFKSLRPVVPKRQTLFATIKMPEITPSTMLPSINMSQKLHFLSKPSQKDISELVTLITSLPSKINFLPKVLNLPKLFENRKTLILDLDETLTHSVNHKENPSIILKISKDVQIGINIRPYAEELLKYVSTEFEVVIFTASQKKYADAILNHLDPENKLIHHRLYREHCYYFKGFYLKDIRILGGRDLKDIIIVDNLVTSFALQIENGIKVNTWTNNPNDTQLKMLIDYLKIQKIARDIRTVNRNTFNLNTLINEELLKRRSLSKF